MKLDKRFDPHLPWKIEDGGVVILGNDKISKCTYCGAIFEIDPLRKNGLCSTGCKLAEAELLIQQSKRKE
jgi:hypothetical protein